eukprot:m.143610 g.143610  ORF g.143610 m.143610 type:complete len:58 (-) comp17701_c0_seq6:679-852(-)
MYAGIELSLKNDIDVEHLKFSKEPFESLERGCIFLQGWMLRLWPCHTFTSSNWWEPN